MNKRNKIILVCGGMFLLANIVGINNSITNNNSFSFLKKVEATALSNSKNTDRKRGSFSSEINHQDANYLIKRTGLVEQKIYELLQAGNSREDIKTCYVIMMYTNDSIDDVFDMYISEKRDIGLTLKDYDLDREEYEKRYAEIFPEDSQTNHDRVAETHAPWRKAPTHKVGK